LELGATSPIVQALLRQWDQQCTGFGPAMPGAREVDLLAVPPDMGLVVADVTVEHLAAQTYVQEDMHKFHADRDHAMCNIQNRSFPVVQLTQLRKLSNKNF
jgi:hypothetical protein